MEYTFGQLLKKQALDFFLTQKDKFDEWEGFFEGFRLFFDDRSADNDYHYFSSMLKQQEHEEYHIWFLRFDKNFQSLQRRGLLPDREEPGFHAFYMRTFYSKLNRFCFATIDKKLKDLSKSTTECSIEDFKRWIEEAKLTEIFFWLSQRKTQTDIRQKYQEDTFFKQTQQQSKENRKAESRHRTTSQKASLLLLRQAWSHT